MSAFPYIQITTRCNMQCAHCMFSCTREGEDMSFEVFKKCISVLRATCSIGTLGGGEPTVHPLFFEFLDYALKELDSAKAGYDVGYDVPPIGMVTNGKIAWKALKLAAMAKQGKCCVALSRDQYHEDISPLVVKAFSTGLLASRIEHGNFRPLNDKDCRSIRGQITQVHPAGRGALNAFRRSPYVSYNKEGKPICCGSGPFISPKGDVWQCQCMENRLGHINDFDAFHEEDGDDYAFDFCSRKRKAFVNSVGNVELEAVASDPAPVQELVLT